MIKPKKVKGIKYKIFNKETKQYELNMLLLPDESFNFFKIESGQYGEFKGRYINIENCDKYEVHYTCI